MIGTIANASTILVGGVLIFASGLGIKKIKTLNLLPALLIPPVAVTILSHFGI